MAGFSPHKLHYCHVRSTSLPARLHPSAKKIEEELNKLTSFELSASLNSKNIFTSLSSLTNVYKSVIDVSDLPTLQHTQAQDQLKGYMNQLLDLSLKYLDICGKIRDTALQMRENARTLHSALRRKKGGDLRGESHAHTYICSRKTMKREISKLFMLLKEVDLLLGTSPPMEGPNYQLCMMIKKLREVSIVTSFVFRLLLLFMLPTLPKPKPARWASVLKMVKIKGVVSATGGQAQNSNEFEVMDTEVSTFLSGEDSETKRIQSVLAKLEALDLTLENLENSLECLFRHMIQARVSLLNILSM